MDVFCEIPCLTEQSKLLSGSALQQKWFKSADKRYMGQSLQKFINYNFSVFQFLQVTPFLVGSDLNTSLKFRTSSYIGAIPLRAPDTGKQIGDFIVVPRFDGKDRYEDHIDILHLLEEKISPEVMDSLPLASGRNFRPPLYLEAVKFITILEKLLKSCWQKFDTIEKKSNQPTGQINWNKHIDNLYKIEKSLQYPVRKNILIEYHNEYAEIRYVFDLCKYELLSPTTPQRIKSTLRAKLSFIEEKMYFHRPQFTENIKIKFSDSPLVKSCKEQANKILSFNLIESIAWRVDFSDVFEKFVQYVFKDVTKEKGGKIFANFKFQSKTTKLYTWELKHLEPDAIYQKDDLVVFIDAKYKSNLYNKYEESDSIKEEYRHDLHQIMSYSSFCNSDSKYSFLCYPSNQLEIKPITYRNDLNRVTNTIFVLGLPMKVSFIKEAKRLIEEKLSLKSEIAFIS